MADRNPGPAGDPSPTRKGRTGSSRAATWLTGTSTWGRWVAAPVGGLALILIAGLVFSPWGSHVGFPYPLVIESVEIAAPCERVHAYLGDSHNARDWSVFVDHITPLNDDVVPDGAEGSLRRSFRNADETGMRWDERLELVEPLRRRLTVYGVTGLPLPPTDGDLLTEQIYEPLGADACRLSFTLFLRDEASVRDAALMHLVAWPTAAIFGSNIENVKRLVEARQPAGSRP